MKDEINELESETSTGKPNAPFRVGIYAPNGTGKSTFCSQCEGVYFLPTEEGVNNIKVPQYKEKIGTLKLLYEILNKLRDKKHPYKAVCLDSASATESLIIAAIEERLKKNTSPKAPKSIADMNDDFGSGYVAIANEWKTLLDKLDELRYKREMNILITANSKVEKIENLEGKDYHKYNIDLFGSKSTKVITSWLDHCLFAREEVSVIPENKYKNIALKGNLALYTRSSASYFAKTRGEIPWPEKLPLDWNTFYRLMKIMVHGKDVSKYLESEFEKVVEIIPADELSKARKVFDGFIENEKWHMADAVIQQAKEDDANKDDINLTEESEDLVD